MRVYTQISSGRKLTDFTKLKSTLSSLDVHLFQLDNPGTDTAWQHYCEELGVYKSIAKSAFHIVDTSATLTTEQALHIAYAMYKKRPVIVMGRFLFDDGVDENIRNIIELHGKRFHKINLLALEFAELSFTLNKLKPHVDYRLSAEEECCILSQVREHLYSIVGRGITEVNAPFQ